MCRQCFSCTPGRLTGLGATLCVLIFDWQSPLLHVTTQSPLPHLFKRNIFEKKKKKENSFPFGRKFPCTCPHRVVLFLFHFIYIRLLLLLLLEFLRFFYFFVKRSRLYNKDILRGCHLALVYYIELLTFYFFT
jgi:hypothetical protein